jgi:hypothetical protein
MVLHYGIVCFSSPYNVMTHKYSQKEKKIMNVTIILAGSIDRRPSV